MQLVGLGKTEENGSIEKKKMVLVKAGKPKHSYSA